MDGDSPRVFNNQEVEAVGDGCPKSGMVLGIPLPGLWNSLEKGWRVPLKGQLIYQ